MFWRRKKHQAETAEEPASDRQYWERDPKPTDGLIVPDVELVSEDRPAEVFPDEIDPAWADSGKAPEDD
jgi:hypothetical protein